MTQGPGHIYRVGSRVYADSRGLRHLAEHHDLVPTASGYRMLEPAITSELVEGRPTLPSQQGNLYELRAADRSQLATACVGWLKGGQIQAGGDFDTWPGGCGCRIPTTNNKGSSR
jgi:hypothetical protein